MVVAALAIQVGRMRRPERPGPDMVDVAARSGHLAAGEAAEQIAHPPELGHLRRGPVVGFGVALGFPIALMVAPLRIASASTGPDTAPRPSSSAVPGCAAAAVVAASRVGWSVITRMTTFDVGRGPADRHDGAPHPQARWSLPWAQAPAASERRSPALRGSSSHTAPVIAVIRFVNTAASVARSRPHTEVVSVSSSPDPMVKSRPRRLAWVRRTASGSCLVTCVSTA